MNNNCTRIPAYALVLAAALGLLGGCGGEEEISTGPTPAMFAPKNQPAASKRETKATPRYVYRGDSRRDPFIALTGSGFTMGSPDEVAIPNLGNLSLKGIFSDGKGKAAIMSAGGITYILKENRLYDNRNRLVKGMTGIIKKESVLMIAPDKTTKELPLREKEEK